MSAARPAYVGRFAPSPSGLLHAGSLVTALASWLDAKSRAGLWRVRIEDLDTARNVDGAAAAILGQLARCGLVADGEVVFQSRRTARYEAALQLLVQGCNAYPCGCSRREIRLRAGRGGTEAVDAESNGASPLGDDDGQGPSGRYPGTCRAGLAGRPARAWRFRVEPAGDDAGAAFALVHWHDRRLGPQAQDVARAVGDFVLKRADGVWAYQLAVVVDDAAQGITDVVRGEDLADNTARQILLQRRLGLPMPRYLHVPLLRAADGSKLSKQTGAAALDLAEPLLALRAAGRVLGIDGGGASLADWLGAAVEAWRARADGQPVGEATPKRFGGGAAGIIAA